MIGYHREDRDLARTSLAWGAKSGPYMVTRGVRIIHEQVGIPNLTTLVPSGTLPVDFMPGQERSIRWAAMWDHIVNRVIRVEAMTKGMHSYHHCLFL